MKNYFIDQKANLNSYFDFRQFNNSMKYAKENISVAGVDKIIAKLNENYKKISLAQDAFIAKKNPLLDALYEDYVKAAQKVNIFLRFRLLSLIAFIILFILASVISSNARSSVIAFLSLLIGLLAMISFIALLIIILICQILKFLANKKKKVYQSSLNDIIEEVPSFLGPFDYTNRKLYQETDDLYLASLGATQREMVLLRREQAEARKAQEKHNAEMRRMQESHNREQIQYQQRAARASEELLEIEKEKERRMRGY